MADCKMLRSMLSIPSILTSWNGVRPRKETIAPPCKNFYTFHDNWKFITLFARAGHWTLPWARWIRSIPMLLKINFNCILPPTVSPQICFVFIQVLRLKFCMYVLLFCAFNMSCQSRHINFFFTVAIFDKDYQLPIYSLCISLHHPVRPNSHNEYVKYEWGIIRILIGKSNKTVVRYKTWMYCMSY
jgi:hypothetical protein